MYRCNSSSRPTRTTGSFNRKTSKYSRGRNSSIGESLRTEQEPYYSMSSGSVDVTDDDAYEIEAYGKNGELRMTEKDGAATNGMLSSQRLAVEDDDGDDVNDKPYALMNGFVKRANRQELLRRQLSDSLKRNTSSNSEESSYVESSLQCLAKYFESNGLPSGIEDTGPAPPPPSSPPPLLPASS